MRQKCYDFFGCKRSTCPMFEEGADSECWDVPDTLNNCVDGKLLVGDLLEDKMVFCKHCLYYKHRNG